MTIVHSLQTAGGYRLAERLGFNGVVATYRGSDAETQTLAGVVVMDAGELENPNAWGRFAGEFERLRHGQASRVCRPLAIGQEPGYYWAAYEFLKGTHLGNVIREQGLPIAPRSLEIIAQTCEALMVMHAAGVPHRCVTPASIFINEIQQVKLLHGGWGGLLLGARGGASHAAFISNLPFLAPEVALGGEGDEASDVYSLGANLFFLLTGQPTHWSGDPAELAGMIGSQPVNMEVLRPLVPQEVFELVDEMLQKDPEDRPVNIEALCQRLDSLAGWLYTAYQDTGALNAQSGYVGIQDAMAQELGTEGDAAGYLPPDPYAESGRDAAYGMASGEVDKNKWAMPDTYQMDEPEQYAASDRRDIAPGSSQGVPPMPSTAPAASHQPVPPSAIPPPMPTFGQPAGGGALVPPPAAPQAEAKPAAPKQPGSPKKLIMVAVLVVVALGILVVGMVVISVMGGGGGDSKAPKPVAEATPAPKPRETKTPKNPTGMQSQYQAQTKKLEKHHASALKAKAVAEASKKYRKSFGRWPRRIGDLRDTGLSEAGMKDAWGRELDVRTDPEDATKFYVVCSGENGVWEDKDDFWIEASEMVLGGYDIEFTLTETTPILGGPNKQMNEILGKAADRQRAELETEIGQ